MTAPIVRRLRRAAASLPAQGMSIRAMAQAHGAEVPGTLLLLVTAPCLLPVPGVGTVFGLGLVALALAIWRGQPCDCLPRRVAEFELSREWAQRILLFLATTYLMAGRYARARMGGVARALSRSWTVCATALMAAIIVLPIPFGNLLPALAIMLLGVGLVFHDGLAMILGLVTSTLALFATTALLMLGWYLGSGWISNLLS